MDNPNARPQPLHLLVVDDDDIDVMVIRRAIQKARILNPITVARDGVEALERLRDGSVPRPYVILLDVNMPRMNGHEFLDQIRRDDELKDSTVFMLTTSESEVDKNAAVNRRVAGYVVKQCAGEEFRDLVHLLDGYWRIVEMPDRGPIGRGRQ